MLRCGNAPCCDAAPQIDPFQTTGYGERLAFCDSFKADCRRRSLKLELALRHVAYGNSRRLVASCRSRLRLAQVGLTVRHFADRATPANDGPPTRGEETWWISNAVRHLHAHRNSTRANFG